MTQRINQSTHRSEETWARDIDDAIEKCIVAARGERRQIESGV